MHELMLENIVERCRKYEQAVRDDTDKPLPRIGDETAVMAIAMLSRERDELKAKIERLTKPRAV